MPCLPRRPRLGEFACRDPRPRQSRAPNETSCDLVMLQLKSLRSAVIHARTVGLTAKIAASRSRYLTVSDLRDNVAGYKFFPGVTGRESQEGRRHGNGQAGS